MDGKQDGEGRVAVIPKEDVQTPPIMPRALVT